MCRKNHAFGIAVAAFFAGLLVGSFFEFCFGLFLVAIAGISLGLGISKKK